MKNKKNKTMDKIQKIGYSLIFLFFTISLNGQGLDTLSLEFCYSQAIKSYPLLKNRELIKESGELRVQNLQKAYLPRLDLSGDAKYLSEVINLNNVLPLPGYEIPSPPNDQYAIVLGLNQIIYDGGAIRWKKEVERITAKVEDQSLTVDLYQIKDRINKLYFSILFLQANDSLFRLSNKEMQEKLDQAAGAVKYGAMLSSELDVLKAENIRLEQQIMENEHNIRAMIAALEVLMDTTIDASAVLLHPHIELSFENPVERPEHLLFFFQQQKLEYNKQLISSARRPTIFGFAQGGYGQPGLNPVNDGFAPYYILGVKLNWNFWDWNNAKREKKILSLQQARVEHQKETFDHNLNVGLKKVREDVVKMGEVLQKDQEIIELRKNIIKTSTSKLENGVIQSADYVRDFNNYLVSLVMHNLHRLQLLQAKFDYLTLKGNSIGDEKQE